MCLALVYNISGRSRNFRSGFQLKKISALVWKLRPKKKAQQFSSYFVSFLSLQTGLSALSHLLKPLPWIVTKKVYPTRPLINWIRRVHIFRGGNSWNHCNPPVSATEYIIKRIRSIKVLKFLLCGTQAFMEIQGVDFSHPYWSFWCLYW